MITLTSAIFLAVVGPNTQAGNAQTNSRLHKSLATCGALPNGSSRSVYETTRMFINLPKDIYPNKKLKITQRGAVALYISNGGPYGYALGARGKPNCWSTYFQFDRTPGNKNQSGVVDIASKSAIKGIPDYLIHVKVVVH